MVQFAECKAKQWSHSNEDCGVLLYAVRPINSREGHGVSLYDVLSRYSMRSTSTFLLLIGYVILEFTLILLWIYTMHFLNVWTFVVCVACESISQEPRLLPIVAMDPEVRSTVDGCCVDKVQNLSELKVHKMIFSYLRSKSNSTCDHCGLYHCWPFQPVLQLSGCWDEGCRYSSSLWVGWFRVLTVWPTGC